VQTLGSSSGVRCLASDDSKGAERSKPPARWDLSWRACIRFHHRTFDGLRRSDLIRSGHPPRARATKIPEMGRPSSARTLSATATPQLGRRLCAITGMKDRSSANARARPPMTKSATRPRSLCDPKVIVNPVGHEERSGGARHLPYHSMLETPINVQKKAKTALRHYVRFP
jgi:hypothetical protein